METERSFTNLARRLGFAAVGYRAEGTFDGATVTLRDIDRSQGIAISCSLLRPMDLALTLATGAAAPKAVTELTKLTGNPDIDGWVSIVGRGEVERATKLLTPELCAAMRGLTGPIGVRITDLLLEVHVATSLPVDAQLAVVRELLALRTVVDEASRAVPVCRELEAMWPLFQRWAQELGVEARSSALGLEGSIDGCAVDVFRFLPVGGALLVQVDFPTPLAGDVLLNSHVGPSVGARIRSLASTLLALGPEPGWFAFGSRFKASRGTLRDVRGVFGDLTELANVARDERSFLNVSAERLFTGIRLSERTAPPDLVQRIRKLVAAAKKIHGVAHRADAAPPGGPYR